MSDINLLLTRTHGRMHAHTHTRLLCEWGGAFHIILCESLQREQVPKETPGHVGSESLSGHPSHG